VRCDLQVAAAIECSHEALSAIHEARLIGALLRLLERWS